MLVDELDIKNQEILSYKDNSLQLDLFSIFEQNKIDELEKDHPDIWSLGIDKFGSKNIFVNRLIHEDIYSANGGTFAFIPIDCEAKELESWINMISI